MAFSRFLQALFLTAMVLNSQVLSQISTPCTAPVTNMFTPCMNFLTNSSGSGGNSPTADCCNVLKGLTGTGFDCLCLLLTASVPFNLPINRTIAASLPRACNMPGVPVQCKGAAGAPLPAQGPASSAAPNQSPNSAGSVFPGSVTPTSSPSSDDTPTTDDDSNTPSTVRPALTPSAATPSTSFSHVVVAMFVGALAMK